MDKAGFAQKKSYNLIALAMGLAASRTLHMNINTTRIPHSSAMP
jgi:hypothetical protein